MTDKEIIETSVKRINEHSDKKVEVEFVPRGFQISINGKFHSTLPTKSQLFGWLDGYETALGL